MGRHVPEVLRSGVDFGKESDAPIISPADAAELHIDWLHHV
jgi:hypothetical protein